MGSLRGIKKLADWDFALLDYKMAFVRDASLSDLKRKWDSLMKSFQVLTGSDHSDRYMNELEFNKYMRECHDEIVPPSIAAFNRICDKA